jgi:hypothetical protein
MAERFEPAIARHGMLFRSPRRPPAKPFPAKLVDAVRRAVLGKRIGWQQKDLRFAVVAIYMYVA